MHFEFCRFRNDIKIRNVAFPWSEIKIRIRTVTLTIFLGLRFVSELEILGLSLSFEFCRFLKRTLKFETPFASLISICFKSFLSLSARFCNCGLVSNFEVLNFAVGF